MKNLKITLFILMISTPLLKAQVVLDSVWHYYGWEVHPAWDLDAKTYYTYNNDGIILEEVRYAETPDSWNKTEKKIYTYNENGFLIQIDTYRWIEEEWGNLEKKIYEYDIYSNVVFYEEWNYYNTVLDDKIRVEYEYDEAGNLLKHIVSAYNPNWGWNTEFKIFFTYDENNNRITELQIDGNGDIAITFTYDSLNRKLVDLYESLDGYNDESITTYYYTGNNLFADSILYQRDYNPQTPTEWRNDEFKSMTYDSNGNLLSKISLDWNNTDEVWRKVWKKENTYDGEGNIIIYSSSNWDEVNQDWLKSRRRINYTFDTNGNQIEAISQKYEDEDEEWLNTSRSSETFNDLDLVTEEYKSQLWNADIADWYKGDHCLKEYDEEGRLLIDEIQKYDSQNDEFFGQTNYTKDVYFYLESNTNIPGIQDEKICDFPNPYQIGTPINCENFDTNKIYEFKVYNLSGKLIHQQIFTGNQNISMNRTIPQGYYIFAFGDNTGNIFSKKILINP